MTSLDDMQLDEAIKLYYEKHHALREGDMQKLLALKKICPDLFLKKYDDQIRGVIEYAKKFQDSPQYKALQRLEVKKTLSIIKNNPDDDHESS